MTVGYKLSKTRQRKKYQVTVDRERYYSHKAALERLKTHANQFMVWVNRGLVKRVKPGYYERNDVDRLYEARFGGITKLKASKMLGLTQRGILRLVSVGQLDLIYPAYNHSNLTSESVNKQIALRSDKNTNGIGKKRLMQILPQKEIGIYEQMFKGV